MREEYRVRPEEQEGVYTISGIPVTLSSKKTDPLRRKPTYILVIKYIYIYVLEER